MVIPAFIIVNNLFYVLLDYMFCSSVFSSKKAIKQDLCLVSWIIVQIALSFILNNAGYIKVPCALLTASIFSYLLFSTSIARVFLSQLSFTAIHSVFELLVVFIIQQFVSVSMSDMRGSLLWVVGGTSSQLLVYIAILIIRSKTHSSDFSSLSVRTWLVYALLPALSLAATFAMGYSFPGTIGEKETLILLFVSVVMLAMNIIAFYLLNYIVVKERIIADSIIQNERNQSINLLYSNIAEQRAEQQAKIHDHKRLITTALALAKKEQYSELIDFLEEQADDAVAYLDNFDCKNPVINAVINTKYNEACTRAISADVQLSDLASINMAKVHLVSIIANIWDNAIEATSQCETSNRLIVFKAVVSEDHLKIYCENTFNGNIQAVNNRLLTSKSDKLSHGYGIDIIQKCAIDCGGTSQVIVEDNTFKIIVKIPTN